MGWGVGGEITASIFIETKEETTDFTYLTQLSTKWSFRNVKKYDQADGMILWYKEVVEG